MGRVIHFELTAADTDAAARFFASAFGWRSTPSPFAPQYLTTETGEGRGIDGAVMSAGYQQQSVILWIDVDDLVATRAAVESSGGRSVGGINEVPGQGLMAYVADPSGVLYGLRQSSAR